jgi:hypothetical protein
MSVLDDIRADVDARFASSEFIPRLLEALYQHQLRLEMKHLWDGGWPEFKGADAYRLYVREKIRLAQRRRWWEEMGDLYAQIKSDKLFEADAMVHLIGGQQERLKQRRLALREYIGEITYG